MVDRHYKKVLVATMRITTNTTPPKQTLSGDLSEYWLNHLVVVIAAGKRPASIPNLEAKPASADGTAPGRVWESRTPPQQPSKGGALGTHVPRAPPLTYTHKKNKKGTAAGARTTAQGPPPFLRKHFLLQHSTRQHTPVSEHHSYARNAAPLGSPRLACNGTTSTHKRQHIRPRILLLLPL